MNILMTSCVEEPESPKIEVGENGQLAKIKSWFEENKTNLRLPERGSNFRSESQELILPFFEKEPDWDKFHHYYFPDGREVFEISLENATKYFLTSMMDSFPDRNPAEVVIQNIMFVKHPTAERFDPLIARYYPDNNLSVSSFQEISYDGIPYDWSGMVDIWTYDERHFIGFIFQKGELTSHFRYGQSNRENSRIQSDCREITREVTYTTVDPDGIVTVHASTIKLTHCSGSGGYTPEGGQGTGDGGEYHDYQRPPCCDDPVPVPSRDLPTYDPPKIPSPETIINQLSNPCAINIFKGLSKNAQDLTSLYGLGALDIFPGMLDLFEQSGRFDYRIQNGNTGGANAVTDRINGVNVITLNNDYLGKATSLSVARTIIHETVHAFLLEHTYNMNLRFNYNTFDLIEKYNAKYPKSIGDTHHAAMSHFILGMAVSLYNWDKMSGPTGGTLGFDYYYKMAFGGLVRKDNPTLLIDEAKQFIPSGSSWADIEKILLNEANGTNQANGTKCN